MIFYRYLDEEGSEHFRYWEAGTAPNRITIKNPDNGFKTYAVRDLLFPIRDFLKYF